VVLIDSMNPKQVSQPLSASLAQRYSFQALLARFGIARLPVKLPAIAPSLPPNEAACYPLYIRPGSLQASTKEHQELPASAAQAAAAKPFLWRSAADRSDRPTELPSYHPTASICLQ